MTKSSAKRFISAAITLAMLLALLLPLLSIGLPASFASTQAEAPNGWKVPSSSEDDLDYYYYIDNKKATGWHELDTPPGFAGPIDGKAWFYFAPAGTAEFPEGAMLNGTRVIDGKTYYLGSGPMFTGWHRHTYYEEAYQSIATILLFFNDDGSQYKGWLKDDGPYDGPTSWYYFDEGHIAVGWQQLEYDGAKQWFYFKSGTITRPDCSMHTGWLKDGGKWYFLNANGTMATGWVKSGGKWYYFNPNGTMVTGWKQIPYQGGSKWFYFAPAGSGYTEGSMYTGIRSINGRQNRFDSSGGWLGYV